MIIDVYENDELIETYFTSNVYVNHSQHFINIIGIDDFMTVHFTKIECDYTHRHFTIYK